MDVSNHALPVSVIIPTWRRVDQLLDTLKRLQTYGADIAEILVHVDAGDTETAPALAAQFPSVQILTAEVTQGPGGGRNRLLTACSHPIVVSLDDDSYPIDADFFAKIRAAFGDNPDAGVLAMSIIHDDEPMIARHEGQRDVADFVGCGCAYRRAVFEAIPGYVPLHPAYGMEEADVALQVMDRGWRIVECGTLRVRHATDRGHQTAPNIVAAHVRNTALLAFLRYPWQLAGYGAAQVLNRMVYSLRRGHVVGVLQGGAQIPATLWRHRRARHVVQSETILARRSLRRNT